MININEVRITGRLVREPTYNTVNTVKKDGKEIFIANFSIAYNQGKKKEDGSWDNEVSFFNVTARGYIAQNMHKFAQKGRLVYIAGYLKQESWKDSKTQENRQKIVIIATNVQSVEKGEQEAEAPTNQSDFMQDTQDNPPPEHTLPPKQTHKKAEPDEGRIIYSSVRDNPKPRKEPAASNGGAWQPPSDGEPPF